MLRGACKRTRYLAYMCCSTLKWGTLRKLHVCHFITMIMVTEFVPIPAYAPITAHQRHFQLKICGTINRPLKSSHPVASDYVPSLVLNTENHQVTLKIVSLASKLRQIAALKFRKIHMCRVAAPSCVSFLPGLR